MLRRSGIQEACRKRPRRRRAGGWGCAGPTTDCVLNSTLSEGRGVVNSGREAQTGELKAKQRAVLEWWVGRDALFRGPGGGGK